MAYGLDFGCGSSPVGFELALRGHKIDFIDVPGAGAYEFLKWRAKKRGLDGRAGFAWGGPYEFVLMLDVIEHLEDWRGVLARIVEAMKDDAILITNYFLNEDYLNVEHISMDKKAVEQFLVSQSVYPLNKMQWVKRDITKGGTT